MPDAERAKHEVGSAMRPVPVKDDADKKICRVYGRRISGTGPSYLDITERDVYDALTTSLQDMTRSFGEMLGRVQARQINMIYDVGFRAAGGSAQLNRLAARVRSDLNGIPVKIAENPWECTTLGMDIIMRDVSLYKVMVTNHQPAHWWK
jgi:actin-like ATPase involved in cell morphogenesis